MPYTEHHFHLMEVGNPKCLECGEDVSSVTQPSKTDDLPENGCHSHMEYLDDCEGCQERRAIMTASKTDGVEELLLNFKAEIFNALGVFELEESSRHPSGVKFWNDIEKATKALITKTLDTELERLEKEALTFHGIEHINGIDIFDEGMDAVPLDTIHKYREGLHEQ